MKPWEQYADQEAAKPWEQYAGEPSQQQSQPEQPPAPNTYKASEVPGAMLSNAPASAGKFVESLYQAVRHPVDTAGNMADAVAGGVRNLMPDNLVSGLDKTKLGIPTLSMISPIAGLTKYAGQEKNGTTPERKADAVGQMYKGRYGGWENVKRTLAEDPVGAAADVSALLTGGAALAGKAPAVSTALKTGAKYANPVNLVTKPIAATGKLAANAVGAFGTHTGGMPIKQAFVSGLQGGKSSADFADNMRGNVPMTDVLDMAKQNLAAMTKAKSADYRVNMAKISGDKTILGFDGINSSVKDAVGMTKFKGQVKNAKAAQVTQQIADEVNKWRKLDPAEFHTPEGLDALKQKIGGIVESIPFEEKTARAAANKVYHSIKNEINVQAPTYAKTMKDYADAADEIKEVERALSLGNKASIDTAMRKLQSLTRNNVNTNYGNRVGLAKTLEQKGGNAMMPALAGQALNTWVPRGIGGTVAGGVGLGGYVAGGIPGALGTLAIQSPRLVGETAYKMGQIGRGVNIPAQYLAGKGLDPATLANMMAISGGLLDPNRQQ